MKIIHAYILALLANPVMAVDWPMHRGEPQLQGRAKDPAPTQPVLKWTFQAGKPIQGSAAIVGNRVFFADEGGTVRALTLADGKEVWAFASGSAIEATPLVLDGTLYIGASDGNFHALDAETGAKRWTFATGDKILAGASWSVDPAGGSKWVLVSSYDFNLYALDAQTGKKVWRVETENNINSTPTISSDGHAIFGGCDALLHVVSLKERKHVRKLDAEAYVGGSAAADGRMVYVGGEARKVFAFDTANGTTLWTYRDRNFPYVSSPAINDDVVIIGGGDKRLHCIDRAKGEARWVFATRGSIDSSPVLCSDGGIIFGSDDGRLYCVELATGKQRWAYEIGADLKASPAVAHDMVVIGAKDGKLYAFGSKP